MNNIEFKKYGNGSSSYEVFMMKDYCPIIGRVRYETLGFVEKNENEWIDGKGKLVAKTRKQLVEKMIGYKNKGLY